MVEHAWVLENIAAYHAGGLEASEREQLQEHIATCEPCAQAFEEAGGIDRTLEALFADVRPNPALEDRMIHALQTRPVRTIWYTPIRMRMVLRTAAGVAAVFFLGALGAQLSTEGMGGWMPFPGMLTEGHRVAAVNNLKQLGTAIYHSRYSQEYPIDAVHMAGGGGTGTSGLQDANQLADARRASELRDLESPVAEFAWKAPAMQTAEVGAPDYKASANGTANRNGHMIQIHNGGSTTVKKFWSETSASPVTIAGKDATGDKLGKTETKPSLSGTPSEAGKPVMDQAPQTIYSYRNDLPGGAPSPPAGSSPYLNLAHPGLNKATNAPQANSETKQKAGGANPDDARKDGKSELMGGQSKEPPSKPGSDPGKASEAKKPEPLPTPVMTRKIIRSGEIEFEIESFDSAVATIIKLVNGIQGGFVATVNSEKLPNGKVRGSVVVRVPPEGLDGLVLDLRRELGKGGELKGQRIGSQDITKQYTDLESRLRAARAMEERLLQVIKTGKGEIKDLVQAEKELGVWRTKIEEIEGELRYYANLVALSTLTITLSERELQAPSAVIETERIQMGLEVEDVDKALRQALAAVTEAKGRVTKSELKQHAAGQYSALLHFEVTPEAAGPMRDRLKQLGNVARLEIDRVQQTEGGSGRPQDAKSKRNDSQFIVSLYNLTTVAPRETVQLKLVCDDVEAVYKTILARVEKAAGRVVTSSLNRQRTEQTTGTISFEVRAADSEAVLQSLKEGGEVMRLQVTENPDVQNTTRSKRGFNVELWTLAQVAPRETSVLQLATRDVPAGYRALQEAVAKAKGRVLSAQLNEQDKQNITAQLDFEIRRAEETTIDAALAKIGDVFARNVVRAQDNDNVIDSKVRVQVSLINAANLKPRESITLAMEVPEVENAQATLTALVNQNRGHTTVSQLTHRRDGSVVAKLVFDVPLAASPALVEQFKTFGKLRLHESSQNAQVPEGPLAVARLDVTLSNTELIVPSDNGLWPQVRKGLSNSLLAIFLSLSWVIFGVLVVLPWALLIYGVYRLVLWLRKKPGSAATTV
jgi:hypothetical protein